MSNFEFIKFTPTPGEKHLGIASVKVYGKLMLRFKIVPTKDGSSFFPAAPSYKMTDGKYISAIMLDSNFEKEELDMCIIENVAKILGKTQTNGNPSVFDTMEDAPF